MSHIFISYAAVDRPIAHQLADALEALGWSVWWDREIPLGKAFDQVIEEELTAAGCVIVLWSEASARSRWVKTEAAAAAERERLLPILIEDVAIPFEFRRIQTAMLSGWRGERDHPEFMRVLEAVKSMLGEPPARTGASAEPPRLGTKPTPRLKRNRVIGAGAAALVVLALIVLVAMKMQSPTAESVPQQPSAAAPGARTTRYRRYRSGHCTAVGSSADLS